MGMAGRTGQLNQVRLMALDAPPDLHSLQKAEKA